MRKGNGTIDMGMRWKQRMSTGTESSEKRAANEEEQAIGVGGISPEVL